MQSSTISHRTRLAVAAVFAIELAVGVGALLIFASWLSRDVPGATSAERGVPVAERAALGGSRPSAVHIDFASAEDQTAVWR